MKTNNLWEILLCIITIIVITGSIFFYNNTNDTKEEYDTNLSMYNKALDDYYIRCNNYNEQMIILKERRINLENSQEDIDHDLLSQYIEDLNEDISLLNNESKIIEKEGKYLDVWYKQLENRKGQYDLIILTTA